MYSFYDFRQDPEDLAELLDPRSWQSSYFAVINADHELAGFFCFEPDGETVKLGLGLKPGNTGKELGSAFRKAGLDFARARFDPAFFRLQVSTFNQRAIRVSEKLGFREERTFQNRTNGGEFEFVCMVRDAKI